MSHLPHSVSYSNAADLMNEFDNLSFNQIKQVMKDVIEDNAKLRKISQQSSIALDQYKELVALVDGVIIEDDEEHMKEKAKASMSEIFLRLIFSMKNTSYWLVILSDMMEKYAAKDEGTNELIRVLKEMSKGILTASQPLKYKHPMKRSKGYLRWNLGKEEAARQIVEEERENFIQACNETFKENYGQQDAETASEAEEKFVHELKEAAVESYLSSCKRHFLLCLEKQEENAAKQKWKKEREGFIASCNETLKESYGQSVDETASDAQEKLVGELEGTTVKPSEDASVSNANKGKHAATVRSPQMTFKNLFSKRKNKTSASSAFPHKRSSKEKDTFVNALQQSENETLERRINKQLQPTKHQFTSSSKVGETESKSKGNRKSRKDSFYVETETIPKSSISSEHHQRRDRKRKTNTKQDMIEKIPRNNFSLKYACVHLSNVLNDPRYSADVIHMSHKGIKQNTKLKEKQKKSLDKGETDNYSLFIKANQAEVEGNVLNAVLDQDKDNKSPEVNIVTEAESVGATRKDLHRPPTSASESSRNEKVHEVGWYMLDAVSDERKKNNNDNKGREANGTEAESVGSNCEDLQKAPTCASEPFRNVSDLQFESLESLELCSGAKEDSFTISKLTVYYFYLDPPGSK